MIKKNVLGNVIIIMIVVLSVAGCGNKNENVGKVELSTNIENVVHGEVVNPNIVLENNERKEEETKEVVFKDLYFVKEVNRSNIDVLEGKYISADNTLYNLDGKNFLEEYEFDDVKYEKGHIIVCKDYKYGIIGKNFKLAIPVEYDEIEIVDEYLVIKKEEKCGLVDKDYNLILPIEYNYITVNSKQYVKFAKENSNGCYIYNPVSKKEFGPFYSSDYLDDEFIIVQKYVGKEDYTNSMVNVKDIETYLFNITNGSLERKDELLDYSFAAGEKFQNNYMIAAKWIEYEGFKQGVLDNNGNVVIPFESKYITNLNDRLLILENEDSYSVVNINNEKIVSFSETGMSAMFNIDLTKDILMIERNYGEKVEYYDLKGNLLYETTYEFSFVVHIGDKKYIIVDDEKNIYLDLTNNTLNKKEIDSSFEIDWTGGNESGYIEKNEDNGVHLYNNKLEPVFEKAYESISLYKTFCLVSENNRYKVLSYNEEVLVDKEFTDYSYISDRELLLFDNENNKYYFKY